MRSILKKNKKGEFAPATFFAVAIAIVIIAPIVLYVINQATGGLFSALNSTAPYAVTEGELAVEKVTNLFDYLVVIIFLLLTLILFISSFMVNTHPVFLVVYLIAAFVLVLIAPNVISAADTLWGHFPTESGQLPFTEFLKNNMMYIIIAMIIVTGIIMYSRFRKVSDGW